MSRIRSQPGMLYLQLFGVQLLLFGIVMQLKPPSGQGDGYYLALFGLGLGVVAMMIGLSRSPGLGNQRPGDEDD